MLEMLRNATGGWIAKIFIGLLVASFAVWGIADIFTGNRGSALATVGKTEISASEFQRVLRTEMRVMSQRLGRNINPEQARAIGLDQQVLSRLVGQAALDNHIAELGLKVPDKAIAESIANNPSFLDGRGNFNRSQFQSALLQSGLSEQFYVASQRSALLRGQIGRIIDTGIKPPEFLLKTLFKYQSEKRQVNYIEIPASAAGAIGEPTDSELSEYFNQNKSLFKSPEFRKITVLTLKPGDVADTIEVTEEDIAKAYAAREDQFKREEKREVLQITFPSKEDAEKARTNLTTFDNYRALAKSRGMKDSDLTLGLVTRAEIVDPLISNAAFSLPEGKISDPVEGSLSVALLYVKSIEKGGLAPLEAVRDVLKSAIALERAQDEILNLHDTIEDERAGGANLNEIAKKLTLNAINIDLIDRNGNDDNGVKIDDLPEPTVLLPQVFESDVDEEITPIETAGNGFIWFNVDKVIPVADRTLDSARSDVVARWKADKKQKNLDAFTKTLVERLQAGDSFLKVASEIGGKVKTSKELTRFDNDGAISQITVAKIFQSDEDEIASASSSEDDTRIIFKVSSISVPSYDSASPDVKALDGFLTTSLGGNLMRHYELALRQDTNIDINQRVWEQVSSGGAAGAEDPFHGAGDHSH